MDQVVGVNPLFQPESEDTPLLGESQSQSDPTTTSTTDEERSTNKFYLHAVVLVFLFAFVGDVGGSLIDTPEVRLLEMAVCRDYYRNHDPSVIGGPPLSYIDEKLCKIHDIQAKLAYIEALSSLLRTIPGILFTFFYGRLADRIGRKPILFLALLGEVLSILWTMFTCYFHEVLSTRLVLLSPAFLIIGGGSQVATALIRTIVTDVSPEAACTTIFYLFAAGTLTTEVVAAPIGSWLLSKDLWLPFKFSFPIMTLAFPLILLMPETLVRPTPKHRQETHQRPFDTADRSWVRSLRRFSSSTKEHMRKLNPRILPKEVMICFMVIFLVTFSGRTGIIYVQYVPKLLDWPISKVSYIQAAKAFLTFGILVLLASITQIFERKGIAQPRSFDTWVIRSSLVCHIIGSILISSGRQSSIIVAGSMFYSASNGMDQTLLGILASQASATSVGQLFAGAAVVQLLAQLSGSLVFAKLFDIGLKFPRVPGIGLPFYASSVLAIVAGALSCLMHTEK